MTIKETTALRHQHDILKIEHPEDRISKFLRKKIHGATNREISKVVRLTIRQTERHLKNLILKGIVDVSASMPPVYRLKDILKKINEEKFKKAIDNVLRTQRKDGNYSYNDYLPEHLHKIAVESGIPEDTIEFKTLLLKFEKKLKFKPFSTVRVS